MKAFTFESEKEACHAKKTTQFAPIMTFSTVGILPSYVEKVLLKILDEFCVSERTPFLLEDKKLEMLFFFFVKQITTKLS